MGVAVFFVLVLLAGAAILYPLLPGRGSPAAAQDVTATDEEIERAVRDLRRARRRGGTVCPTCGSAHKPDDRFCVHCGAQLPQAARPGPVCPACGTVLHEGDRFCPKCGHSMEPLEAA